MVVTALWARIKANDRLHLAWCVVGIVGCLVAYGVLQERIMTEPYGPPGAEELFKFSLFLVLCNRLTSCAVAVGSLLASGKREELKPVAPLYAYAAVSLSNIMATFCQYEALRHISFPVQTLGKCAKMLPVMIWGIFILRKTYGFRDFGLALLITAGCTVFLLTGEVKSKVGGSMWESSMWGMLLMGGYLGMDGFTSTFQDRMFKGYSMTTYNQILYTTLCSSALSFFGLASSGQFPMAVSFISRHPEALWNVITLSVSATVGTLFISYTIKTFGSLVFATIMTTRQFLSILLSCLLFAHPLSAGQWFGSAMVFGTLYYQSATKSHKDPKSGKSTSSSSSASSLGPNGGPALAGTEKGALSGAAGLKPTSPSAGVQVHVASDEEALQPLLGAPAAQLSARDGQYGGVGFGYGYLQSEHRVPSPRLASEAMRGR